MTAAQLPAIYARAQYEKRRDELDRLADEAQLRGVVVPPDLETEIGFTWSYSDTVSYCEHRAWLEKYDPDPLEGNSVTSKITRMAYVAEAQRIVRG